MYRITANVASTHMSRRGRRRTEPLQEGADPIDVHPERSPSAMAEFGDLRERVDTAVAGLSPKLRAVVVLRDVYDMPHEAIAEELGISVSAAKVRLHRARAQLKAQLFAPVGGDVREL
jgi:RNA polymerase sigma-70 factor (ECF subfamily)